MKRLLFLLPFAIFGCDGGSPSPPQVRLYEPVVIATELTVSGATADDPVDNVSGLAKIQLVDTMGKPIQRAGAPLYIVWADLDPAMDMWIFDGTGTACPPLGSVNGVPVTGNAFNDVRHVVTMPGGIAFVWVAVQALPGKHLPCGAKCDIRIGLSLCSVRTPTMKTLKFQVDTTAGNRKRNVVARFTQTEDIFWNEYWPASDFQCPPHIDCTSHRCTTPPKAPESFHCFGCYGDFDGDMDCDFTDFGVFQSCFNGPNRTYKGDWCECIDADADNDVDIVDFGHFMTAFDGPNRVPASCSDCVE